MRGTDRSGQSAGRVHYQRGPKRCPHEVDATESEGSAAAAGGADPVGEASRGIKPPSVCIPAARIDRAVQGVHDGACHVLPSVAIPRRRSTAPPRGRPVLGCGVALSGTPGLRRHCVHDAGRARPPSSMLRLVGEPSLAVTLITRPWTAGPGSLVGWVASGHGRDTSPEDLFQVAVADMERAVRFYLEAFGASVVF